ncbi:glutamate receptor ionotropic, delta-1 [Caerostris extrusa]|uniref:Glutamate receptor ionotropic, delta-1 n=1 Tax=Caerostris extrusa TaxID=172846 RepID=A0AAV4QSQ5_CAEEX|nr:glutamate receptor ionotropic, delta-1 [Caerostris extrusa]
MAKVQAIVANEWYINDVPMPLNDQMDRYSAMVSDKAWLSVAAGSERWKHYYIAEESLLPYPIAVAMKKIFFV